MLFAALKGSIFYVFKNMQGAVCYTLRRGLMAFSFPALVYKQNALEYIKAMFIFPQLTKVQSSIMNFCLSCVIFLIARKAKILFSINLFNNQIFNVSYTKCRV